MTKTRGIIQSVKLHINGNINDSIDINKGIRSFNFVKSFVFLDLNEKYPPKTNIQKKMNPYIITIGLLLESEYPSQVRKKTGYNKIIKYKINIHLIFLRSLKLFIFLIFPKFILLNSPY